MSAKSDAELTHSEDEEALGDTDGHCGNHEGEEGEEETQEEDEEEVTEDDEVAASEVPIIFKKPAAVVMKKPAAGANVADNASATDGDDDGSTLRLPGGEPDLESLFGLIGSQEDPLLEAEDALDPSQPTAATEEGAAAAIQALDGDAAVAASTETPPTPQKAIASPAPSQVCILSGQVKNQRLGDTCLGRFESEFNKPKSRSKLPKYVFSRCWVVSPSCSIYKYRSR